MTNTFQNNRERTYAEPGYCYGYVLDLNGRWFNQGMVPDNNRAPFVAEWCGRVGAVPGKGTKVAWVPFCFTGVTTMTDSEIYSYGQCIDA